MGDLLGAVLVDHVVVRHRDRVGVAEVDLVLSGPRFPLGGLHADAGAVHPVADLPDQRLVVGRGEDVVVEDVRDRGGEVPVVLRVRLFVALLEQEELELGAEHRRVAERLGALDLGFQHLPRRGLDVRTVMREHVAEHERRALEPRDAAKGREVRREPEVAVALVPARERIAGDRIHLHLEREQVVAALDAVLGRLLDEELAVEPLAHQAPLHVGEGDDDGVDRAVSRPPTAVPRKRSRARE